MPKNISFAMTIDQVKNKTKTVTRRQGWKKLRVGEVLQPVEKTMGIKKGESVKKIGGLIRVTRIDRQKLTLIDQADVAREGFPDMKPYAFVKMYCRAYKINPAEYCNRIEFEYL